MQHIDDDREKEKQQKKMKRNPKFAHCKKGTTRKTRR